MMPLALCVHKTRTRARIRIPSRKGDRSFFEVLRERLGHCDQITATVVNPVTGSVLISYSGDFSAIAEYAAKGNFFLLAPEKHYLSTLAGTTVTAYKSLDLRVKELTGGEVDLPGAVFLALMGTGVYQITKGRFAAPTWYTAFWYALNIFLKSHGKGKPE